MLTHIGVDQYGQSYHLFTKHPRKELIEQHFPHRKVDKMYVDKIDGTTRHIGYTFGGHSGLWVRLWKAELWDGVA